MVIISSTSLSDQKSNSVKVFKPKAEKRRKRLLKWWDARYLLALLTPMMIYYLFFHYVPMYGLLLAFKDLNFNAGILGSPWVGFKHFHYMFNLPEFLRVFQNTLIIAFGRLIIEFPIPIIIALLLNEVRHKRLKKFFQTVYTFPHFLSWVIISGIMLNFLGDMGVFNQILVSLGLEKINLLTNINTFKGLIFGSSIWKEMGWGTIIYLAAMAGINPELYEAASIDGAGRWRKMFSITWPALRNTVLVLLILQLGNVMGGAGFDQIFNIDNAVVRPTSEILDTYIYRATFFQGLGFGFTTAVGLFKSIINFILLISAHHIVKSRGHGGLF